MHIFPSRTKEIIEKCLIYLFITVSIDTSLSIHAALACMYLVIGLISSYACLLIKILTFDINIII